MHIEIVFKALIWKYLKLRIKEESLSEKEVEIKRRRKERNRRRQRKRNAEERNANRSLDQIERIKHIHQRQQQVKKYYPPIIYFKAKTHK